ncbi:HD domain-containing protein [Afifella sp. IM 167]|uniref:HD domain-containing protein n=1 Tax=Afifella sp. IM 167 TaxID=2033586 RepID=UPI001CC9BE07|nr:HD domain-containing protein [Afifella sp. IM 167]MBZ8132903.1 phosphohydrolase [Afifella sp. IM 167]
MPRPSSDTLFLARAFAYATRCHSGATRKGFVGAPYIDHVAEVAALLAENIEGAAADVIVAAILHGTVEKGGASREEIADLFGERVAGWVDEMTDDESLPRAERMRRQVEHVATASRPVRLIELADKTSNLAEVAASPPEGWSAERFAEYVEWGAEVANHCRGIDEGLEARFDEALAAARETAIRLGKEARGA